MNAASTRGDALAPALLIAAALHMLLIFGISFEAEPPAPAPRQFEVTLLQAASGPLPEELRHIAAADQAGSGSEALREYAAAAGNRRPATRPAAPAAAAGGERRERRTVQPVSSVRAEWRVARGGERAQQAGAELPQEQELALLEQRLATLEAQLDGQQGAVASQRVRRVDAVAAQSAVDAAYLAAWRQRVEAVGNRYYPTASLRYGIFGRLRLLVSVRSDGQLEDVRILESSGQRVLDQAAIRIVRMAAPFPPFPAALRADTDRLDIVRTWQFEQNPLSSD